MPRSVLGPLLIALLAMSGCTDDDPPSDPPCTGDLCPGSPGSPTFSGVRSVAVASASGPTSARVVRVTWLAATDDKTPTEQIKYRVYVSAHAGRATKKAAVVTSDPGATSAYVVIDPGTSLSSSSASGAGQHLIVVRALDTDGREDGNTVEKIAPLGIDSTAPDFAGIKAWRPESGAGVTLTFDPPRDDMTPLEGMRYVVNGEDGATIATFEAPADGGKNEITVRGLGLPGSKKRLALLALDAAGHIGVSNTTLTEVTVGPDAAAPVFAGCASAEALGSKVVRVSWLPATDDSTAKNAMAYEVFVATAAGAHNFAGPPSATIKGAESLVIHGLAPGTTHHIVCRARDESGNSDPNALAKMVTTTDNVTAPTFTGASGVFDGPMREASLSWAAATDDKTPADKIVYAIYQAHAAPDGFNFDAPPLMVTVPGALSVKLTNLPSRSSYRFIVRARDEDYNEDQNALETTGSTPTSFSLDVVPLFAQNCAVVGCHVAPVSMGGMSLSAYNVYENIVDVNAGQRPALKRILPFDSASSYLYQKVTGAAGIAGNPMPAPGTGNVLSSEQRDILRTWIDQGALRN